MSDRIALAVAVSVLLLGLLTAGPAFASVKCQCNNGATSIAMGADADDEDAEESCNDACSGMGGGQVWSVDDDNDDDDVTVERRHRDRKPAARRR